MIFRPSAVLAVLVKANHAVPLRLRWHDGRNVPAWVAGTRPAKTRGQRRPIFIALAPMLALGGCFHAAPDCTAAQVGPAIGDLFLKQLRFTPYMRFLDIDGSGLDIEAIFTTASKKDGVSCVAFARYHVKLTADGQKVEGHNDLLYSLVDELGNEKQVYYTVTQATDGQVHVHVDRVGG